MSASCSMFSQILKLIPRTDFERIVKQTKAEHRSKGLSSWSQFVAMLFCQLGRAHSLREIEGGLKSCEGKLAHLGIEAPARSSLSYANAHRPWELFQQVFYGLYETVAARVRAPRKFRFKHKLVSLDSTVIDLCLSMYDWAKFRRTKWAVKLHLVLDHDGRGNALGHHRFSRKCQCSRRLGKVVNNHQSMQMSCELILNRVYSHLLGERRWPRGRRPRWYSACPRSTTRGWVTASATTWSKCW